MSEAEIKKISEPVRWFLAGCAAGGAFFAALYFNLLFVLFSPFPRALAEPIGGFVMGSLLVLAGAFVAPRRRVIAALLLCLAGTVVALFLRAPSALWALPGGLTAAGYTAWWFRPHRTSRAARGFAIAVAVVFSACIGFGYARYVDWPARPEEMPSELKNALGSNSSGVTAFYRYDLGGFIDHQWLWRIDAGAETMALIVAGLELQPVNDVPGKFLTMPPHYWPRTTPKDAQAFQSHDFSAADRGPDGSHYFLLHDKTRGQAFVWFKFNF